MRIEAGAELKALMQTTHRIAVVGLSNNPARPSYRVAEYLISAGYDVVPVNPGLREVLGRVCYPNLQAIEGQVDMVDVFRRSEEVAQITDDAIAIGAKSLWLQLGVIDEDSADRAAAAGLAVVMDRCIKIDHAALLG
jgi:predicted CoA-binding protein